jgi:hypothetical protein
VLSAALMVIYMAAIASAWVRELRIDCGCFGSCGGLAAGVTPTYGVELRRDAALLVGAVLLARWPRGYFAIDGLLARGRNEAAQIPAPQPADRKRSAPPRGWDISPPRQLTECSAGHSACHM